jgi:transposase
MEQYIGLDVSQEQTSVCVVDDGGKVIWEGKCASTPEAIAATIRTRTPKVVRIGLESGPLSAWHWHKLRKLSLPVVCLDARPRRVIGIDGAARATARRLERRGSVPCAGL